MELIARPGDTVIVPLSSSGQATPDQHDYVKRALESELPGVKIVTAEGLAGGPWIYRPAPTDPRFERVN